MAMLSFGGINMRILGAILLGKAALCALAYAAAFALHRGPDRALRGGIYAFFSTAGCVLFCCAPRHTLSRTHVPWRARASSNDGNFGYPLLLVLDQKLADYILVISTCPAHPSHRARAAR